MQIKAFTIIELLVAMAITALTVSLAWYGLNLFQRQYSLLKESHEKKQEFDHFVYLLRKDAFNCKAFLASEKLFFRSDSILVKYYFMNDHIERAYQMNEMEFKDVFPFKGKIREAYFEKKIVENGFIDFVSIGIDFFEKTQLLPLRMWYSSEEYIRKDEFRFK